MTIAIGDLVPALELYIQTEEGPTPTMSDKLLGARRIAMFGVPGAFTRTCSARHLPGFVANADAIKAHGIDDILCLAVNDAAVLAAWSTAHGADQAVSMVSDGSLNFTRACGFEVDMRAKGYGPRCRRFSMLLDDRRVTHLHLEEPGQFGATSAETLLQDLEA